MPPYPMWHLGRDTVVAAMTASWNPDLPGYVSRFRMLPIAANRQPAAAAYVRVRDDSPYHPFAIGVMRVEDDRIVELTAFHDVDMFRAFGLPPALR